MEGARLGRKVGEVCNLARYDGHRGRDGGMQDACVQSQANLRLAALARARLQTSPTLPPRRFHKSGLEASTERLRFYLERFKLNCSRADGIAERPRGPTATSRGQRPRKLFVSGIRHEGGGGNRASPSAPPGRIPFCNAIRGRCPRLVADGPPGHFSKGIAPKRDMPKRPHFNFSRSKPLFRSSA